MMRELGFCSGIENYSRILDGRPQGSAPHTLLDYFPSDFLVFVDETHHTVPQIRGMYEGDRSRKQTLVEYGFRLPSALDNRPLRFDEFLARWGSSCSSPRRPGPSSCATRSASPSRSSARPGSSTPSRPPPDANQIDDLLGEIRQREQAGERVLVTTLTKKMAEDLTDYLSSRG